VQDIFVSTCFLCALSASVVNVWLRPLAALRSQPPLWCVDGLLNGADTSWFELRTLQRSLVLQQKQDRA